MSADRTYRVSELAELSGLSVRTLHYYDEIGLLAPSGRSDAGYRRYGHAELLRLQQILIQRALGLPLAEIARVLDDPNFDYREALLAQRDALERRLGQTRHMIAAVDAALSTLSRKGYATEDTPMKELFDGFDPARYADEARQRWGHTDAYKASAERVKGYTKDDWQRLRDEQTAIYADAFALMRAGELPDSDAAMDVAERHRLSIDRWFYPCSAAMHSGLADLWENDVRFAENIDKHGEGLTPFLAAAVRANAARVA